MTIAGHRHIICDSCHTGQLVVDVDVLSSCPECGILYTVVPISGLDHATGLHVNYLLLAQIMPGPDEPEIAENA